MNELRNSLTSRLFSDSDPSSIDPFALFEEWFAEARDSEPNDPNAMALASVDAGGMPDVRMVLLNGRDERGFVFFTNLDSDKGVQLAGQAKAALLFHWKSLRRQIRIRGPVERVSNDEADIYFASRPLRSQVGAHASLQSRVLESRDVLESRVHDLEGVYGDGPVPRPENWSGFRVCPSQIEFWQDGAFRLHDRVKFERGSEDAPWRAHRLYP